jgi:folate-binding protein YgfZ
VDEIFESAPDFIDPAARDVVTVTGPDAASYLHSQLAQDVTDLAVGDSRWTFVLEPTGKIDVLARVTRTADQTFTFDTDAGFGEALAERINRFKIRVDASVEVHESTGAEPSAEHEMARVGACWPRMGHEIVPGETIPATTGIVEQAVSFTKGCYPGQELVERMHSRGADAPRSLRLLEVDGSAAVGDPILDGEAAVGTITSVAGSRALGYVKRGSDVGIAPQP